MGDHIFRHPLMVIEGCPGCLLLKVFCATKVPLASHVLFRMLIFHHGHAHLMPTEERCRVRPWQTPPLSVSITGRARQYQTKYRSEMALNYLPSLPTHPQLNLWTLPVPHLSALKFLTPYPTNLR